MSDPALLEALKTNLNYPKVVEAILAESKLNVGEALIWAAQNGHHSVVKSIIRILGEDASFTQIEVWEAFFLAKPDSLMDIKGLFLDIFKASPREKIDIRAARTAFERAVTRLQNQEQNKG